MSERLLIIAAKWIVEMASSRPSLDDCRREVERRRNDCLTFDKQSWVEESIADCEAWLAAAKLHEEQRVMAERLRAKIAAAPQEALSDAERAECVAELDLAMAQTGRVSNGEVLLMILEKARKESEELKAKLEMGQDAPIEDLVERAESVAKELRKRGLWAACEADGFGGGVVGVNRRRLYSVVENERETLGPRAVADLIQAEEARRAQEWAANE